MAKVGRALWVHLAQTLLEQGHPRAGCPGLCPSSYLKISEEENPQPLWAAHASALPPTQHTSAS